MTIRTLAKLVIAALGVAGALGCTANTTQPMTVEVRDRGTGSPVEGALVVAQTEHFFLYGLGDRVIDPSPTSVRGRTDRAGLVLLDVADRSPVEIIASAPGFVPLRMDLEEHPALTRRTSEWLGVEGEFTGLEVRFAPP